MNTEEHKYKNVCRTCLCIHMIMIIVCIQRHIYSELRTQNSNRNFLWKLHLLYPLFATVFFSSKKLIKNIWLKNCWNKRFFLTFCLCSLKMRKKQRRALIKQKKEPDNIFGLWAFHSMPFYISDRQFHATEQQQMLKESTQQSTLMKTNWTDMGVVRELT